MTGPGRGVRRHRGTRHLLGVGCALSLLLLAGCATGGDAAGEGSPTPRADLAGQAEVAAENLEKLPAGQKAKRDKRAQAAKAGRQDTGQSEPDQDRSTGTSGTTGATGATTTGLSWRPVGQARDAGGDHGNGPAYADLSSLTLEDDGTHLRLTVQVGATLPGTLGTGEVQGVGVDLYRLSRDESDFQVFLDGGEHGWRGFLQTPRGFVRYPGTLSVAGRTLVAVVPWSALGGRADAQVSAFADWSDGRGRSSADTVERGAMSVG